MDHLREAGAARALAAAAIFALLAACGSNEPTAPPPGFDPGVPAPVANGQQVQLPGGTTGAEFVLVVTDTLTSGTGTSNYTLTTAGLGAPGAVSAPATALIPSAAPSLDLAPSSGPTLDIGFGARLNERYRRRLGPLSRSAGAARSASISVQPASRAVQVGDVITYNVNEDACDVIVNHGARVVAIGAQSIIVADTLNPAGGFTAADYQRFAANFDTLIYPVDVQNFGAPSDIDANGRVVLFFTRAVNALTPANSGSYVGGFFSSRDLFPRVATARLQACAGSNQAEMFYLLAPDPAGSINGNVRSTGFVDSLTTGVVAHEFQHLINASRRIYVNNASALEDVWLNEGLSHIAEELLFYRESGLSPRQNISVTTLRTSAAAVSAFNKDQASNASRYRSYLTAPSASSPIRDDDSLSTRGATWDFLRYAADRKLRGGGQDASVWQALVNNTATGVANLRGVFGSDVGGQLRDWSVSHYTDDVVPAVPADLTQPSWNWHNIFPALGSGGGTYPLKVSPLTAATTTGTLVPGAAAFYRFSVAANTTGTVTIAGGAAASGLPQGTVVRIR